MYLKKIASVVLELPRPVKRLVALAVDSSICVISVWLAFYLRLGEFVSLAGPSLWLSIVSMLVAVPIFIVSGLYRAIFRYSGWAALTTVGKAVLAYGLLFGTVVTVIGIPGVPRTIGLIQPILLLLMVGCSRALARLWLGDLYQRQLRQANLRKVLIYGAGSAGRQLAAAMANNHEMRVVGFLDDDDRLHGHVLNGHAIYNPADLPSVVGSLGVSDVLLALPSVNRKRRNEILRAMQMAKVSVRTLPSVMDLAQGRVVVSDLHELDVDDLLGREPVVPNHILLSKNISGRVVLVTGAGGSIGSELSRQILQQGPSTLLLFEQSEFALYEIHQELQAKLDANAYASSVTLVPILGSIRDAGRVREVLSTWKPGTVYHAAAYKHVPLVEHNPVEGIRNNVFGTLTVATIAAEEGVPDFVLISTDKAVRPTNVMGASKRLAEMVLQALAASNSRTRFSMVRFGNVLGSSGSVVPKFRQQIRDGGPITLTHPEITRYFMTIPEAAQLVIQAGALAKGGEVFVLDMGQPVKILDLARRMVELSGLSVRSEAHPEGDIEISITGLRPGEKLYEELLIGDNPQPTSHPRIMRAHEDFYPWPQLLERLNAVQAALDVGDVREVRCLLEQMVCGYQPKGEIVDWIHVMQETERQTAEIFARRIAQS